MKILITVAFFISVISAKSQDTSKPVVVIGSDTPRVSISKDTFFMKVEVEAHYPGGDKALSKFVNENIQYPEKAKKKKIEGTVMLRFIIEEDGTVGNVWVRDGPKKGGLREEAIRVIKLTKWEPANQNGKVVRAYYVYPIVFKLD